MATRATPRAIRRQTAKKVADYLVSGSSALEGQLTGAKPWFHSKTLWVNLVALLALLAQHATGFAIDGELQAALLVVINLVLRLATTKPIAARDKAVAKKAAGGAAVGAVVAVALLLASCGAAYTCQVAAVELTDGIVPGGAHLHVTCDGQPVCDVEALVLSLGGRVPIEGGEPGVTP